MPMPLMGWVRVAATVVALLPAIGTIGCTGQAPSAEEKRAAEARAAAAKRAAKAKVAVADRTPEGLYRRNCAVCHGETGRGDGAAAYLLNPKPRDFRRGAFRLVSADNGVATEADLAKTIKRGMPGTPMPPWPQLTDAERAGLARYVLGLARDELVQVYTKRGSTPEQAAERAKKKLSAGKLIEGTPPDGNDTPEALKASFVELCAKCHAEDGTGRDDPTWRTTEGFPITSRDFKAGVFKGGRESLELFRRVAAGMPGTPMPSFATLPPEQIWRMVRYIQSLSKPEAQERAWVASHQLPARRVDAVPAEAASSAWDAAESKHLALLPLWAGPGALSEVTVRVVYDRDRVGILLEWADPANDVGGTGTTFSDGAAVMLAVGADPPPFTMGAPGEIAEIWHWRAAAGGRPGPTAIADRYYADGHGWGDPRPAASGDVFQTARAAKNPKATGPGKGRASELGSEQFGSLTPRPGDEEAARVDAVHKDGRWRVAFVRNRTTKRNVDVELGAGVVMSIAFAAWDGRIGDRDGKKSVSIWNHLRLQ